MSSFFFYKDAADTHSFLPQQVIYQLQSKKCIVCQKHDRCIILQPCQHYVLCENCAPSQTECPYCRTKILKW